MQHLVSTRWIRLVGLAAFVSIVGAMLIPFGLPWTVWAILLCVSLALTAALGLRGRSTPSINAILADMEGEPVPVAPSAGRSSGRL